MAQTSINFEMDADLKDDFEAVCEDMGMSMSTAFTIFAKRVVREQAVPFAVEADPFYSESNMRALRESLAQLDMGEGTARAVDGSEVPYQS
jgi:DNA-damage-inducible protein J